MPKSRHKSERRRWFGRGRRRPAEQSDAEQSDAEWPVAERPAEPVLSIISEPLREREPRPRPPRATVGLDAELPPLELVASSGQRVFVADLAKAAPLALVLAAAGSDPLDARFCAELREAGIAVVLVTRDGAAGTPACPEAFEVLGEGSGGVFVVDCNGVLRLSYGLDEPGAWLPPNVVTVRVRRLLG